eukprot:gene1208-584_t
MPGVNCCFNECGVNRRKTKSGIKYSLFKIPTAIDEKSEKWRREVLNVITRFRVQDDDFKRQMTNDKLHICEKHYKPDDITIHEGPKLTKKFVKFGAVPSQNFPKKSVDTSKKDVSRKARTIVQDIVLNKVHWYYKDIQDVKTRVTKLVLTEWAITMKENKVMLTKYQCPYILPKLEITIHEDLAYTISVYKWFLPEDHFLYKDFKRTVRLVTISDLVKKLETLQICIGHTENALSGKSIRHAIPLESKPDATEMNQPFTSTEYFRSTDCKLLILGEQCDPCKLQEVLQTRHKRRCRARQSIPAKTKAPVSLTSTKRLKLTLQAQRLQCRQLQAKVKEMGVEITKNSVEIERVEP